MGESKKPSAEDKKLAQTFAKVATLAEPDRNRFLIRLEQVDPVLKVAVARLLGIYETERDLVEPTIVTEEIMPEEEMAKTDAEVQPNELLNNFKLLDLLGEGGMGEVYLAEQRRPIQRLVAIKLIRSGYFSTQILRRFEDEGKFLALLEHPYIARIYEAGTGSRNEGPFLVMEYVPGKTITEYCKREKLGLKDRLELFLKVCEGISHAHRRGIIHRDIKPTNILIREIRGQALPKIIDFGVAKWIDYDDQAGTMDGSLLGSPAYMSPEQLRGEHTDLDTRTDVFSLGILLHLLLVGEFPFDLDPASPVDVISHVLYKDAPRPSARLRSIINRQPELVAKFFDEPSTIQKQLKGDLDWILLKAIAREREERYSSVEALAEDVRNFLANRPVVARPKHKLYLISKFVQRNKWAVLGVSLVFLSLVGGVTGASLGLVEARNERAKAKKSEMDAKALNDFLLQLLESPDPLEEGRNVKVLDLFDKALASLEEQPEENRFMELGVRGVIGKAYANMGLQQKAEEQLKKAISSGERVFGEQHPRVLQFKHSLAVLVFLMGRTQEGLELMSKTAKQMEAVNTRLARSTINARADEGWMLSDMGEFDKAMVILEEVLADNLEVFGELHHDTLNAYSNLANIYFRQGKVDQAIPILRKELALSRQVNGDTHPDTLVSMNNLAAVLTNQGKNEEALTYLTEVYKLAKEAFGLESVKIVSYGLGVARIYQSLGNSDEAEKVLAELEEHTLEHIAPGNFERMQLLGSLGESFFRRKQWQESLTYSGRVVAETDWEDSRARRRVARTWLMHGMTHGHLGEHEKGELFVQKVYEAILSDRLFQEKMGVIYLNDILNFYKGWGKDETVKQLEQRIEQFRKSLPGAENNP